MFPFTLLFDAILYRRNLMFYGISFALTLLMLTSLMYTVMGTGKMRYGIGEFTEDLAVMTGVRDTDVRPPLTGYLPPVPSGWVRRDYLRTDGEIITQGTEALGRTAQLRRGGDLERLDFLTGSGRDQTVRVYARDDLRVAIGLRRPPPLLSIRGETLTAMALTGRETMEADLSTEVGDTVFLRRSRSLPDADAAMPYDLYRAEAAGGVVIEVLSNAPEALVADMIQAIDLPKR